MNTNFLLLSAVWVGGLVLGVAQVTGGTLAATVALLLFILIIFHRFSYPLVVVCAGVLLLGALWGTDHDRQDRMVSSSTCQVAGLLAGEVIDRPVHEGTQARFFIRDTRDCTYAIYATAGTNIFRGDEVVVQGSVQLLSDINGDNEGFKQFLEQRGAAGVLRYGEVRQVQEHRTYAQHLRTWLLSRLYQIFPEPEGALAAAMLFDERGGLPQDIADRFRVTGTSHILAISGSNISVLVGLLLLTVWMIPIAPWLRTLILLAVVWGYILLIDQPVSAVRASFFWTVALLAFRLSALMSLPAVIVLTVVTLATLYPPILADVGFQLSLGAVIGIATTFFLGRRVLREYQDVGVVDLWLSSLGAFLVTVPIGLYHFGTLSFIGLLANIVIVPTMSLIYVMMVAVLVVGVVHVGLAQALAWGVHLVWKFADGFIVLMARVPFAYVENVHLPLWGVGIFFGLLMVGSVGILTWQKRNWREIWQ